MPADISGRDIDRRTILSDVLKRWIRMNREVAKDWQGHDAPWWYGERASLSILAGAVWRSGGVAFEEYSEDKLHVPHHGAQKMPYSGRCDLFFQLAGKEFVVEAKQGWSGGTTDHDLAPRIQQSLRAARKAASRLPPSGQKRLAIVFVVPWFKGRYKQDAEQMIRRWVTGICKIPRWSKAWVFPKTCRMLKSSSGRFFPGVAIFVRTVPRRLRET